MANTKYDWAKWETEYIASDELSVRAIAKELGMPNVSVAHEYARRHQWADKRAMRQARTNEKRMALLGDKMAMRQIKLEDLVDKMITTIGTALDKLERDLREDQVAVTPRDLALLADRVLVLRGQPSQITEERKFGLSLSGPVEPKQLAAILELTRGVSVTDGARTRGPAIPRAEDPGLN